MTFNHCHPSVIYVIKYCGFIIDKIPCCHPLNGSGEVVTRATQTLQPLPTTRTWQLDREHLPLEPAPRCRADGLTRSFRFNPDVKFELE